MNKNAKREGTVSIIKYKTPKHVFCMDTFY